MAETGIFVKQESLILDKTDEKKFNTNNLIVLDKE